MLTDYSDMEQELSKAEEPKILPRGATVLARIIAVREGTSEKNDCQYYQPVFDVPDDPMVIEFNDFFWDLSDARGKVDPKQQARNMYKFKTFAEAIGLDLSRPFNWEDDLIGKECFVILGVRKSDEYGDSNTVQKYVTRK